MIILLLRKTTKRVSLNRIADKASGYNYCIEWGLGYIWSIEISTGDLFMVRTNHQLD